MTRSAAALALLLPAVLMTAGCQHVPLESQTAALTLPPDAAARRSVQQRRFDTTDEPALLSAAAGVLQDLGFTIEESESAAGLIVASKDRDAVESGQVAGAVLLAALMAATGAPVANPTWERNQRIRISIAARPLPDDEAVIVRATFQRVIWNTANRVSRVETIDDPLVHREFFDKLSQSVFLEAHDL